MLAATSCAATVIAIPAADLLIPGDLELFPLDAIPVLVGIRLLNRKGAVRLAVLAELAQMGEWFIDRTSTFALLIAITTIVGVILLARPRPKNCPPGRRVRPSTVGYRRQEAAQSEVERLSRREREIVLLTFEGMTAMDVAESLFISKRTVETHLASAYRKLGVTSKLQLVTRHRDLTGALD
jgi:DNA-binding CsgD family transcriptional regulator